MRGTLTPRRQTGDVTGPPGVLSRVPKNLPDFTKHWTSVLGPVLSFVSEDELSSLTPTKFRWSPNDLCFTVGSRV